MADTVVLVRSGSIGVVGTVADAAAGASSFLALVLLADDHKSGPSTYQQIYRGPRTLAPICRESQISACPKVDLGSGQQRTTISSAMILTRPLRLVFRDIRVGRASAVRLCGGKAVLVPDYWRANYLNGHHSLADTIDACFSRSFDMTYGAAS